MGERKSRCGARARRSCRAVASFKYQFPRDKFSPGSAGTPRSRDPYGNGDRSSESSLRVETSREGQPSYPLFSSIFRVAVSPPCPSPRAI